MLGPTRRSLLQGLVAAGAAVVALPALRMLEAAQPVVDRLHTMAFHAKGTIVTWVGGSWVPANRENAQERAIGVVVDDGKVVTSGYAQICVTLPEPGKVMVMSAHPRT